MKSFAAALIATAINARGTTGGINQGYANASLGASHGYGYNVGNDYTHGDSHGQYMAHNDATTYEEGYSIDGGYNKQADIDHIYGYDMIPRETTTTYAAYSLQRVNPGDVDGAPLTPVPGDPEASEWLNRQVEKIMAEVNKAVLERANYIQDVLDRRRERLEEIHNDNSIKIVAPFELQIDLLEEEIEDVTKAKANAVEDLDDAYDDLLSRMEDYLQDRFDAMDAEKRKVDRLINRAFEEAKSVRDVFYGMKLDWLSGVFFTAPGSYNYDDQIFDDSVYDHEFDMFTFDIGHGKGHGHTQHQGPGNNNEIGMVVGRGGSGDISTLRGEPVAQDGVRRRYDKMTQSGRGSPGSPSDWELGLQNQRADGEFNYNQAADLGVEGQARRRPARRQRPGARRPARRPTQGRRRPAPAAARRPAQRRPSVQRPRTPQRQAPGYGYRGI